MPATPGRVDRVGIDAARRVQSLYVAASDGVRLAVDVWLPVEQLAPGAANRWLVTYLTEGCLRFLHRQTAGPAEHLPRCPGAELGRRAQCTAVTTARSATRAMSM